jgi:hypothetical protein
MFRCYQAQFSTYYGWIPAGQAILTQMNSEQKVIKPYPCITVARKYHYDFFRI